MDDNEALKEYLRDLKQIGTRVNPTFYNRVMKILQRDGVSFQSLIGEAIINHLKIHEDGNKNYKLELFQDKDFMATPAFYRTRPVWQEYLATLDAEAFKEFDSQLQMLLNVANRRFKELG